MPGISTCQDEGAGGGGSWLQGCLCLCPALPGGIWPLSTFFPRWRLYLAPRRSLKSGTRRGGGSPEPLWEVRTEPVPAPSCPSCFQTRFLRPCPIPVTPGQRQRVLSRVLREGSRGRLPSQNPSRDAPREGEAPGRCLAPTPRSKSTRLPRRARAAACSLLPAPRAGSAAVGGRSPAGQGACRLCPCPLRRAVFFQQSSLCRSTFAVAQAQGSPPGPRRLLFHVLCSVLLPLPAPSLVSKSSLKNARL